VARRLACNASTVPHMHGRTLRKSLSALQVTAISVCPNRRYSWTPLFRHLHLFMTRSDVLEEAQKLQSRYVLVIDQRKMLVNEGRAAPNDLWCYIPSRCTNEAPLGIPDSLGGGTQEGCARLRAHCRHRHADRDAMPKGASSARRFIAAELETTKSDSLSTGECVAIKVELSANLNSVQPTLASG